MARKSASEPRSCAEDVEIAVKAAALDPDGVDAILVGLLRSLARKIDGAGDEGPSDRVLAAYLSAQKDLARTVVARERAAEAEAKRAAAAAKASETAGSTPSGPPQLKIVKETPLERIRREKAERATG